MSTSDGVVGGGGGGGTSAVTELVVVVQSSDATLGPETAENYTLSVTAPQATLTAPTVFGALRGLETFSQLTFGGGGAGGSKAATATATRYLPPVLIVDKPRFGYRALMVDTARLFRPVALLEEMMDSMAAAKLNALYLHLTDDGCWSVLPPPKPLHVVCQNSPILLTISAAQYHLVQFPSSN